MMKAMTALKFLCVAVTILGTTVACGKKEAKDRPNPFLVDGYYDVNAVTLTCTGANCTNSVGIILTVSVTRESSYWGYNTITTSVHRCTGALYSPTQVLTAGHCTGSIGTGSRTFFKTVATPGRPSQLFEIAGVAKTFYDDKAEYSADYATLNLKTPAVGLDYVRPPTFISKDLNDVTALVVNQPGEDLKTYNVDSVDCEMDTVNMPLHISDYPIVWGTKRCKLVSGNSGGPLFARGKLIEVLGVLSKSTEANANKTDTLSVLRELLRGNRGGERPNLATAAHAGCFDLPGWSRPAPQCNSLTSSSLSTLKERKLRDGLKPGMLRMVREFQGSSNARFSMGAAQVKAAPHVLAVGRYDYSFKQKKGQVVLPRPMCIESGTPTNAEISGSYPVLEVDLTASGDILRNMGDTMKVRMSVTKQSNGKWLTKYSFSSGTYLYNPDSSAVVNLSYTGFEVELYPCTGDEDKRIYDGLANAL